jgi:transcriptional regulator with GAF, ATPase, and Fis domain
MLYFMERFARKAGKQVRGIATASLEAAMKYDWPGNVRELSNLVERAVVLAKGPVLELDPRLFPVRPSERPSAAPRTAAAGDEAQRRALLDALERTNWVIEGEQGAARLLNVTPSTARSRMKRLGIARPA